MSDLERLRRAEFAFPGPLRDQLVAAILRGEKTSTTGLLVEYELEGEPLPEPGDRSVVVDSDDRPVAVIEITERRVIPVHEVDLQFAREEGEGFETVSEWRAAHESFWHSPEVLAGLGQPDFRVTDDTLVVASRFRLVEQLGP
ncbi:MAG: hypothetical protein QOE36_3490 [Gaiellaceae bacterium]|jgi:uncharacterized protein YhfF|nr:hypothetical protein [Gaiellaceae bacterium]